MREVRASPSITLTPAAMGARKLQGSASEGYGMVKRKKQHACTSESAESARRVKKRKRVIKQRLPKALIDLMVARPFRSIEDLTPAQLAKRSREFRQLYALTTFVDGKLRGYEQALIRQYNAEACAEEDFEVVTDSEEDATVVEN